MLFKLAQPMEIVVAAKRNRHTPSFFIAIDLLEHCGEIYLVTTLNMAAISQIFQNVETAFFGGFCRFEKRSRVTP